VFAEYLKLKHKVFKTVYRYLNTPINPTVQYFHYVSTTFILMF